ncbi:glycosyltransferase family A protein [Allocoleopsis sp.]|uniref:glycosyltransferase n=1 Tax=Allocoleopsis sp. TaxID=3088169 RepID=UPI002FCF0248
MGQEPVEKHLPSFSIVLETENLANANLKGLSQSLASLAQQDVSPTQANEVWLIDSGDAPANLLEQLCEKYSWIKVHQVPLGTGYYKAKMLGAELSTGEIVVYFDSDCSYQTNWLRNILTPFTQEDQVQIVAGETMTRGLGIYGTAMVIAYIFPPYSGEETLTPTTQYFLNNVAFRREFLLQHSIPTQLPLYRGNCAIHAYKLCQEGYTIWRQPQARATHAPPSSVSHFFWRFLLIGHDYYWQNTLLAQANFDPGGYRNSMAGLREKMKVFIDRFRKMVRHEPRHLVYIPIALPVALSAVALVAVGYIITSIKGNYLLTVYNNLLGEV